MRTPSRWASSRIRVRSGAVGKRREGVEHRLDHHRIDQRAQQHEGGQHTTGRERPRARPPTGAPDQREHDERGDHDVDGLGFQQVHGVRRPGLVGQAVVASMLTQRDPEGQRDDTAEHLDRRHREGDLGPPTARQPGDQRATRPGEPEGREHDDRHCQRGPAPDPGPPREVLATPQLGRREVLRRVGGAERPARHRVPWHPQQREHSEEGGTGDRHRHGRAPLGHPATVVVATRVSRRPCHRRISSDWSIPALARRAAPMPPPARTSS